MRKRRFGAHRDRHVEQVTLESADAAVAILSYGCVVQDWRVDGDGGTVPVVIGFPEFGDYLQHSHAHGSIAGRVANRTAGATFDLDDHTYNLTRNHGPHHLHGGAVGLQRRTWDMDSDTSAAAVTLGYHSPDGEEGYPGAVDFRITYRLEGPRLICEMTARPDRPTPINLAQHNYYNLAGGGEVRDHVLWVAASQQTPVCDDLIPIGTIEPVEGTTVDFRDARSLDAADPARRGIDNNLVLDADRDRDAPAARVSCPRTDRALRLWTDQPGLQVFDAGTFEMPVRGPDGRTYPRFSGMCLEPQHFPDSLHNPDWPSIIRTAEEPYFQRLTVEIVSG